MGRLGIYVSSKIEKEIRDIYQLEIQNGAHPSEVSLSSVCNELLRQGLIMHNAKKNKDSFSQQKWNREILRKVTGSYEAVLMILTMINEMQLKAPGLNDDAAIDTMLSQYLSEIKKAEDTAESNHFVKPEQAE